MGHEASHVLLRHSNQKISQRFIDLIALLFMLFEVDVGLIGSFFAEKLDNFYELKYDRLTEY